MRHVSIGWPDSRLAEFATLNGGESKEPNPGVIAISGVADVGANVFTVSLAETNGWASTASMRIAVVAAPLLASLSVSQGTNLVLNWSGGQTP